MTGGCGGVGLEIVKMCFSQGISCVIVDREKNGPDIKIPIEVNVRLDSFLRALITTQTRCFMFKLI